jgi:hypothetical protein
LGGFGSLLILFEVLDAINVGGLGLLSINSWRGFIGFFLYGFIPVLLYFAGVSLYLSREWARLATVYLIFPTAFFLILNTVYKVVRARYFMYQSPAIEIMLFHPGPFLRMILLYLTLTVPSVRYLRDQRIKDYFRLVSSSKV